MEEDGRAERPQLAHDLRNHLFMISLSVQALEKDREPAQLAEILRQIRAELTAAEKIASALEDAEPDSPEP